MAKNVLPNTEPTSREKQVLLVYKKHWEKYHVAPTVREIADQLGVFPNAAQYLIKRLEAKGYIEKRPVTVLRLKLSVKGERVKP